MSDVFDELLLTLVTLADPRLARYSCLPPLFNNLGSGGGCRLMMGVIELRTEKDLLILSPTEAEKGRLRTGLVGEVGEEVRWPISDTVT